MADFETLKSAVLADWKAQAKWREQAEDDFAFVAGHQWTETEKAEMEEKGRAAIVFNRVAVIMSAVAGSEINNRTEVRFIPREIGDAKPNEVLTAGAEWFRDLAMAEDEESEAFSHMLTCGLGWTETGLDFEADDEGEPEIDSIWPTEMCWDRHAHRKGLTDSRRFARVREMPKDEAESRFPGHDLTDIHCGWIKTAGDESESHNIPGDEYRDREKELEETGDTVTVVQVQYRERQRVVEYMGEDGQRQEMAASKWQIIAKKAPELPPHRTLTRWVWKQAFMGARDFLEENQPDPMASTFNAMTGHWDSKEKCFFGLLRSMRDPQKFANKWLSQTLHIVNSNAKGGVMAEPGAVEDVREFEESWAATDAVTWLKDGAMASGRIAEKPKVQMPAALMSLTEFAVSSIRDASGVNMELLGLRDQNQPGVLEYQRRQSAMSTLARFFDALRFYRKRQGSNILHFLRTHIAPTGRLVRIVSEGQAQYVPLAMDAQTRKYDVIVDDAPQAPNEKEKSWSVIEAMLPMLQAAGLGWDDWAELLEYSPLPSSLVEKVRQKAEQQQDPQQQQEQEQMRQLALQREQLEQAKLQSETMENQAEAQLDMAKAQEAGANARLAPLQTLADLTKPMPAPQSPDGPGIGLPPR
jgi:hypothetical protein